MQVSGGVQFPWSVPPSPAAPHCRPYPSGNAGEDDDVAAANGDGGELGAFPQAIGAHVTAKEKPPVGRGR
jgi:hypothetical protein